MTLVRYCCRRHFHIYIIEYLQFLKQGNQHLIGPALLHVCISMYIIYSKRQNCLHSSFSLSIFCRATASGKVSVWLWVHCKVLRHGRTPPSATSAPKTTSSSGLQLNEILLWVFTGDILGFSLVVEREVLAVLPFDTLHLLVSICLFSPVEESGSYRQASHNHKDHHCYDTCKVEDIYFDIFRHVGKYICLMRRLVSILYRWV